MNTSKENDNYSAVIKYWNNLETILDVIFKFNSKIKNKYNDQYSECKKNLYIKIYKFFDNNELTKEDALKLIVNSNKIEIESLEFKLLDCNSIICGLKSKDNNGNFCLSVVIGKINNDIKNGIETLIEHENKKETVKIKNQYFDSTSISLFTINNDDNNSSKLTSYFDNNMLVNNGISDDENTYMVNCINNECRYINWLHLILNDNYDRVTYSKTFIQYISNEINEKIDSIKVLNEINLKLFWEKINFKIRHHKKNLSENIEGYEFVDYSFPEFTKDSFAELKINNKGITKFKQIAMFRKCNFYGKANFQNFEFSKKANFNLAKFHDNVTFKQVRFWDETYFRKSYFFKEVSFEAATLKDVTFEGITFPKEHNINLTRATFFDVVWTNFIENSDVEKINAERETYAKLKQENNNRGNYIDSNLFFAAESESYLNERIRRLKNYKSIFKESKFENADNKYSHGPIAYLTNLIDFLPFAFAKHTNYYGTNWIKPLILLIIFSYSMTYFYKPNFDFVSTSSTPNIFLENNKTKIRTELINDIETKIFRNSYYNSYDYEFQDGSRKIIKDDRSISLAFIISSSFPNFISNEKWFIDKDNSLGDRVQKILISLMMIYLISAMLIAIKNRTKRG